MTDELTPVNRIGIDWELPSLDMLKGLPSATSLHSLLTKPAITKSKSPLIVPIGLDAKGSLQTIDLIACPNVLIAGMPSTGKSTLVSAMLTSLLYRNSPSNLKLVIYDSTRLELTRFNNIPHLLAPVIVDPEKLISALKWCVAETERRYKLLAEVGKRNINEFNAAGRDDTMPFIVVAIDELSEELLGWGTDALILRLVERGRAAGVSLLMTTRRLTNSDFIKSALPSVTCRISFKVTTQAESRILFDGTGAERLKATADMLVLNPDISSPLRIKSVNVKSESIDKVVGYLNTEQAPEYNREINSQPVGVTGSTVPGDVPEIDDDLYNSAVEVVQRTGNATASLLQRSLRVGYARSVRLLDMLEEQGVIGPADGARPRVVLKTTTSNAKPLPIRGTVVEPEEQVNEVSEVRPVPHYTPTPVKAKSSSGGGFLALLFLVISILIVVGAFHISPILGWLTILIPTFILIAMAQG